MPESLADLLMRRSFRSAADALVHDVHELAAAQSNVSNPSSTTNAIHRWAHDLLRRQAEELFRDLLKELVKPHVVTCEDLIESLWLSLSGDVGDSWYEFFCRHVSAEVSRPRSSKPFAGIEGHFLVFDGRNNTFPMWCGPSGMSVYCAGDAAIETEEDEEDSIPVPRVVYFRVQGSCSARALDAFGIEVASALASVLKSVEMLKSLETNIAWPPRTPVAFNFTMGEDDRLDIWPVGPLLNAIYTGSEKKDSTDRRIRNAFHLIIESDRQRHDGIALSLAVAAIEALLCSGTSELTTQIAENTATLLEPDPHLRAAAERFMKDLYKARSRTLHGDVLEHEAEDRHHARTLAAAVLHAILERREYQRRMGEVSESRDDFLSELRDSKWVGGEIPGISPSPVRQLWRPKPVIPEAASQ